jgi:hypothetical protein
MIAVVRGKDVGAIGAQTDPDGRGNVDFIGSPAVGAAQSELIPAFVGAFRLVVEAGETQRAFDRLVAFIELHRKMEEIGYEIGDFAAAVLENFASGFDVVLKSLAGAFGALFVGDVGHERLPHQLA